MASLSEKLRFSVFSEIAKDRLTHCAARRARNMTIMALLALAMIAAPATRSADQPCPGEKKSGCAVKVDLAFIIDRSGSLDISKRGQTYDVQLQAIATALRDPDLIPQNGSVAVAVVAFADEPTILVEKTEINSAEDAEAVARRVECNKCVAPPGGFCPEPPTSFCPVFGLSQGSFFGKALLLADKELNKPVTPDAINPARRRIFIASTDGGLTDLKESAEVANGVEKASKTEGIIARLDIILLGADAEENNEGEIANIVFPKPPDDLPGRVLTIKPDNCNAPNQESFADCADQVTEFANFIRVAFTRDFKVTTDADTPPNAPVIDGARSLRQAIEQANCNDGPATITFDKNVKIIKPEEPLPALTAPDIKIDGCSGEDCLDSVTIDGSMTDTTKGEAHRYGILIRSTRVSVLRLRIINFEMAGIAVDPVCPFDKVGGNRIEQNRLEDNKEAGVLILDPSPDSDGSNNFGNRISSNTISGSRTLIDLGGDGPTANDPGDLDEGPNRLLNFPENVVVAQIGDSATITGTAAPNGEVEIFEVVRLDPSSDDPVADAVRPLTTALTDGNGAFSATGVPPSSTGFYVVTATDAIPDGISANTSELNNLVVCGLAAAKITLEGGNDVLEFEPVVAPDEALISMTNSRTFTVENTGCQPLSVGFASITREVTNRTLPTNGGNLDDSKFFTVSIIDAQEQEKAFNRESEPILIHRGINNARRFRVFFHPEIPAPARSKDRLSASNVLPNNFRSKVFLNLNGVRTDSVTINATVDGRVRFIDNAGNAETAQAQFEHSGNDATVSFFVYDSDLNADKVEFTFLDKNGNALPVNNPSISLQEAIRLRKVKVVVGQSYEVRQRFTNGKVLSKVCSVAVKVFEGAAPKDDTESASRCSRRTVAQSLSLNKNRVTTISLPSLRLAFDRTEVR
ncbi:MAG TPA: hypothetical protein VF131_00235 [Blastocatellia bacterium]|nr:hypothetical protein [Blastocatellia bacterium]